MKAKNSHGVDDPASETLKLTVITPDGVERGRRSFCLIVMEGPDKGATFSLTTGRHVIGRTNECDIVIHGRGISRAHAAVIVKAYGEVIAEDLGSTNGIFLDGERIEKKAMEAGQTLSLGPEVKVRLELSASSVQRLLQEMFASATRDALTGLLTRRGFEQRIEIEFAMVCRHDMHSCLAVLDLDHFKEVNDQQGHEAGDVVLRGLADFLQEEVRLGDLVCRWGGEEFTLYIRQTPLEGGVALLERLREEFSALEIALPEGRATQVSFSAGVVDLRDFQDWRAAFRKADEALYRAKAEGRNKICWFSPDEIRGI